MTDHLITNAGAVGPTGRVDIQLEVTGRRQETPRVVRFDLRDPSGQALPVWEPGAHIDLELGADRLVRSYSLCRYPGDRFTMSIAVLRELAGRGGSAALHDDITVNNVVRVVGIRNHFPVEPAPEYVFIAGGIGITPFLPMIAALNQTGTPWTLHYAGKSRNTMAFLAELTTMHPDRVISYPSISGERLQLTTVLQSTCPLSQRTCLYQRGQVRCQGIRGADLSGTTRYATTS